VSEGIIEKAEFGSRAVRSMVELHEQELRDFLATWKRFKASGKPMPEAHGDSDYESAEKLVTHVQGAARGYMTWMLEVLGQPKADLEIVRDPALVVPRLDDYMEETLAAWRRHLAPLVDDQLGPTQYLSRWGVPFMIDQMLEHAVVHPMRHRIQLERLLRG
jgi:hypothetical protein